MYYASFLTFFVNCLLRMHALRNRVSWGIPVVENEKLNKDLWVFSNFEAFCWVILSRWTFYYWVRYIDIYDVIYLVMYLIWLEQMSSTVPQREVQLKPLTLPLYSPRVTKKETVISFPGGRDLTGNGYISERDLPYY